MMVNTVLGPVASDKLGQTLMHEHITCADWSMRMNFGDKFLQYDKLVEMALRSAEVKEYGIDSRVDGTAGSTWAATFTRCGMWLKSPVSTSWLPPVSTIRGGLAGHAG